MQVTLRLWQGTTKMQKISDTDEGAAHVGRMISNELRGAMALSGCENVEITINATDRKTEDTRSGNAGYVQSACGSSEAETRARRLVNLIEDAISAGVQIGRDSMRK